MCHFLKYLHYGLHSFRLVTDGNTSAVAALFKNSLPENAFNKVYRNNMNAESFNNDMSEILQAILLATKTAAFISESTGKSSEEYSKCKVCIYIIMNIGSLDTKINANGMLIYFCRLKMFGHIGKVI